MNYKYHERSFGSEIVQVKLHKVHSDTPPSSTNPCASGQIPCGQGCLRALGRTECPSNADLSNCSAVPIGSFCEADGECGTLTPGCSIGDVGLCGINNCQKDGVNGHYRYDVYEVMAPLSSPATATNWGFKNKTLWVDAGLRASFSVTFASRGAHIMPEVQLVYTWHCRMCGACDHLRAQPL